MIKKTYAIFNGKIIKKEKIKISPYDLGVLRGYGVFDVMRAEKENPILAKNHYEKIKQSAKIIGIEIPFGFEEFEKKTRKLLQKNKQKSSLVRTVVTGGISLDAITFSGKPTWYILTEKYRPLAKQIYQKGVKIIFLNYQRDNHQAKITNYIFSIKNQPLKKKKKAFEIIYVKDGKILEGSASNIFMVKSGKIFTSRQGIFSGCTRGLVIHLAKKRKIGVKEKEIFQEDFLTADEIFLTGSGKGIVPVTQVENLKIKNGQVGEITKILMDDYDQFVKNYKSE